jgi:hypothetical protein
VIPRPPLRRVAVGPPDLAGRKREADSASGPTAGGASTATVADALPEQLLGVPVAVTVAVAGPAVVNVCVTFAPVAVPPSEKRHVRAAPGSFGTVAAKLAGVPTTATAGALICGAGVVPA